MNGLATWVEGDEEEEEEEEEEEAPRRNQSLFNH